MNNFYTPALFISDYYDSLVREIDIYTEELMNEYSESDTLPPEPERIFVNKLIMTKQDKRLKYVDDNKYTAEYEYEVKKNLEVIPGSTKVHEYLNMVRENAIAVIRKSEQDSFKKYNENRDKFKMIKGNINEEQIEMLKKELFSDNFCFLIRIDYLPNYKNAFSNRQTLFSKSLFRLYTIQTDFYLRESDIHYIRSQLGYELEYNGLRYFARYPEMKLNKLLLLANQVKEYICGLSAFQKYGHEIIHIEEKTLLNSQRIEFDNWTFNGIEFSDASCLIGIKSLYIGNKYNQYNKGKYLVNDLSSLSNLEFVEIYGIKLSQAPFMNLNKLIKLTLEDCDLSEFHINSLYSLPSLFVLQIGDKYESRKCFKNIAACPNYEIDFDSLPSLKWLALYNLYDPNEIKVFTKQRRNNSFCITTDSRWGELFKITGTNFDQAYF